MGGQRFAGFLDRLDEGVAEFLVSKMLAHSIDQSLPELFPALFVDRLVADDREFVRARRDENENTILLSGFVHVEPVKFLLGRKQGIAF